VYDEARAAGKAVGLGLGLKNSGLGNGFVEISRSVVRFEDDGTVEVRHCWTEMGQGVHTVALQVAVEELGIEPDRVRVVVDTTRELGAGQTTGSRGTLMASGSVADACRAAKADGCRTGIDYPGEFRVDWTHHLGEPGVEHPTIHAAFGYAAQVVIAGYALTEDFPSDPVTGFPVPTTLRALGILRAKDVPPIEVVLVESPEPNAPYGIKGVGEIGLVPTSGAVARALHQWDGQWRTSLPMRPRGDAE